MSKELEDEYSGNSEYLAIVWDLYRVFGIR
jgi:hypothetical protein